MEHNEFMSYIAPAQLSPFNVDLLEKKLADRDELVRRYFEKCEENTLIQQNLVSITESAQNMQQMYTNENTLKTKLQKENEDLQKQLNAVLAQLSTIQNQQINHDTLNKQTIAEQEEKLAKSKIDYLELCATLVRQGNILHANNLSTNELTRKCSAAKEKLTANGIEWSKSPSKPQRKSKVTRTIGTQLDRTEFGDAAKKMCNKSTQHQQTKATRSTCTSAFISKTDSGMNTDNLAVEHPIDLNMNANADSILGNGIPFPVVVPSKVSTDTQTNVPEYRTQETLTTINNVRKLVDYVACTEFNSPHELKEEHDPSPHIDTHLRSMNHSYISEYEMLRSLKLLVSAKQITLFDLLGLCVKYMKEMGVNPDNDEKSASDKAAPGHPIIDSDYESSRDSVESYNSAKVKICKIRDLSNCSPELDEHINQRIFAPIQSPLVESSKSKSMDIEVEVSDVPATTLMASIQTSFTSTNQMCSKNLIETPSQAPIQKQCSLQASNSNSPVINDESARKLNEQQPEKDAAHFKVPKRKSAKFVSGTTKKRKTTNVSQNFTSTNDFDTKRADFIFHFQNKKQTKDTLFSIFGDLSDSDDNDIDEKNIDEEHIQSILNAFKLPKMLSPIKEWPTEVERQSTSKTHSNGFERINFVIEEEPKPLQVSNERNGMEISFSQQIEEFIGPTMATKLIVESIPKEIEMSSEPLNQSCESSMELTSTQIEEISESKQPSNESKSSSEPSSMISDFLPPIELTAQGTNKSLEPMEIQPIATESEIETETEIETHPSIDLMPMPEAVSDSIGSDANIIENEVNQTSIECMDEYDDYSPASPKPDDQITAEIPPEIPLNTILSQNHCLEDDNDHSEQSSVFTNSAFDQTIYNYSQNIQNEVQMCGAKFSDADCYLIASLRNAIEKYCLAEWTSENVTKCVEKLWSLTQRPKYLATAILEVVEDTKENLSLEFTPPAPAMQPSHQKCILLVVRLTQIVPSFNAYLQFELERRLFTFAKEISIEAMTNLAHFFIALIDIEQPANQSKVRFFIYKCLYYFKIKAVPLVFAVIMAHHNALPHVNSVELQQDPLILAIVSSLSNNITYFDTEKDGKFFKKSEMFHTLKRVYGFFADKMFPTESVIDHCIACIRENRLKHVDYALILIAKRQDYEYAVTEIIKKHLIPMLIQYFSIDLNVNTEHDEKIQLILFTIGSIVKTFPLEQSVDGYLDIFKKCLNSTQRQTIQEAAILAICQLNRFGTHQIYHHLKDWKPNYQISTQIQATLNTIVHRKPHSFWFGDGKN